MAKKTCKTNDPSESESDLKGIWAVLATPTVSAVVSGASVGKPPISLPRSHAERDQFWMPIVTLCNEELIAVSQELIENRLDKNVDWRKVEGLSAPAHDAVMHIAKVVLTDLVGNFADVAFSHNIDTSKGRRKLRILPGKPADAAKLSAGTGLSHRRKIHRFKEAKKIAKEIKEIEDDANLSPLDKKLAMQKKRGQGIQQIEKSRVFTAEEKERHKKIFSKDLEESSEARVSADQEYQVIKEKNKIAKVKAVTKQTWKKIIGKAPNSVIGGTANTINTGQNAVRSSSKIKDRILNRFLKDGELASGTTNSQSATTTAKPNGQEPPSKSRGKKRRNLGRVAGGLGEAAAVGVGETSDTLKF